MKRFIRCVCLLLTISLILPTTAFAAAPEPAAGTYSLYFVSYDSWLYKLSDLKFAICFDVVAKRTMQELGVRTIEIQRSDDGVTGWSTRKTFTPDVYTQMFCENTVGHGDHVTYVGSYGHYYRAYMEFYAKDSSGTGVICDYTPVIYIPPNT